MSNEWEPALVALKQIQQLEKKYKCTCRNELLGKRARVIITDEKVQLAIEELERVVWNGDS